MTLKRSLILLEFDFLKIFFFNGIKFSAWNVRVFHLQNHQNPKSAKSIVETQDSQTQKLLIVLSWKEENPFMADTMLVVVTNSIRIDETKTTI